MKNYFSTCQTLRDGNLVIRAGEIISYTGKDDDDLDLYSGIPLSDESLKKIKSAKYFHELQNIVHDIYIDLLYPTKS